MDISIATQEVAGVLLKLYSLKNRNTSTLFDFLRGLYAILMESGVPSTTAEKTVRHMEHQHNLDHNYCERGSPGYWNVLLGRALAAEVFDWRPDGRKIRAAETKKVMALICRFQSKLEYVELNENANRALQARLTPVTDFSGFTTGAPRTRFYEESITPKEQSTQSDASRFVEDKRTVLHVVSGKKYVTLPLYGLLRKIALELHRTGVHPAEFNYPAFKMYMSSKGIYFDKVNGACPFIFLANGGDNMTITGRDLHREIIELFYKNAIPLPGRVPTFLEALSMQLQRTTQNKKFC